MEELKRQNPVIGALLEGKGELDEHEALKEFIRTPKKVLNKISFYGLRVKTIDILGVFRYAISKEQGGERYDYPTTIYEHVENLSGMFRLLRYWRESGAAANPRFWICCGTIC